MLLQGTLGLSLYFDFEDDAQLKQWDTQGTWIIEKDKESGSKVLAGEGAGEVIALVGEVNWTDYTVECEASGQTDEIAIAFRAQNADNFVSFMVAPSLNLSEWFQKKGGQFDENIAAKGDKLTIVSTYVPAITLDIQGTSFLVDGKPTFLLGASYYGGLGASDDFVNRDLRELKNHGFNWIRVWATWSAFGNNVLAIDAEGKTREPYLSKLKCLCEKADQLEMIVDVTLSRGNGTVGSGLLPSFEAHLNAMTALTQELKQFRNIYFDIGNERNIRDRRHVPFEELGALRDRIKELDVERLVTASHAGDISTEDLHDYLTVVQVDFICPHRPRNAESPHQTAEKTQEYLYHMQELGRIVPVHYQEPFRRGFGNWQPETQDFLIDLKNARQGSAAGWCLHNGDVRKKDDGRPRRSFDMREAEGRLFYQLEAEEKSVVEQATFE